MSKFDRKAIAATLACTSLFGGKASAASNKSAARGVAYSMMTFVGTAAITSEVLGVVTNADIWYKGRFSIVNCVKYLLAPKLEQRKALFDKINALFQSFGELDFFLTKAQLEDINNRFVVQGGDPVKCFSKAMSDLKLLDPDGIKEFDKAAKEGSKVGGKIKFTTIANGFVFKSEKKGRRQYMIVKYGVDSVVFEREESVLRENGTKSTDHEKYFYTMNKDGSLKVKYSSVDNGGEKEEWEACLWPKDSEVLKKFSHIK